MDTFTVYKHDHLGQETLHYPARLLSRTDTAIIVEAIFQRAPMELGYVSLTPGDRFVEHFYADRWYNVFAIYAADAARGELKGWYCNITRPAVITANAVRADDLALDYFVQPDGNALILDEAEFEALPLTTAERAQALSALHELRQLAARRAGPFAVA